MVIDKENKVAYLHIPKCGGTTIKNYFEKNDGIIFSNAHDKIDNFKYYFIKYDIKRQIAFIRHPVDWFMSFYSHSKYHGIYRDIVDLGFDSFVINNLSMYENYINDITDEKTEFYDLLTLQMVMEKEGHIIDFKSNLVPRRNIISEENYNLIHDFYKNSFVISYDQKCVVGDVSKEILKINKPVSKGFFRIKIKR